MAVFDFDDFDLAYPAEETVGAFAFDDYEPNHPLDDSQPVLEEDEQFTWICLQCSSIEAKFDRIGRHWICARCHGTSFHRSDRPTRTHVSSGTWPNMPFNQKSGSQQSRRRRRRRARHDDDPGPGDEAWPEERAESEAWTNDPIVDPGLTPPPSNPRERGHPKGGRCAQVHQETGQREADFQEAAPQATPLADTEEARITKALKKLLRSKSSEASQENQDEWASLSGPKPGLKWRGGSAPSPPQWKYDREDVRAWSKYQKKVELLWQLQCSAFMSKKEMSLALYTSLQGDLEQELEHMPVNQIYSDEGVNTIAQVCRRKLKEVF